MRKTNFKALFAATLVVFAFLAISVNQGRAQSSVISVGANGLYDYPTKITFVSPSQAEIILAAHVDGLRTYVNSLPPGSPAYNVAYRASVFYRAILQSLQGGKNVKDAFMDGIGMFVTTYFNGASFSEKMGLRQESIGLLSTAPVPSGSTN